MLHNHRHYQKLLFFVLLLAFIALPLWLSASSHEEDGEAKSAFQHIVFFYLNEDATEQQIAQLKEDCQNLLGAIKTVQKIEVGVPAGTEREVVDNEYGVGIIVHFEDKEGHDFYQQAERHLDFIERNQATWERVQVYDLITR